MCVAEVAKALGKLKKGKAPGSSNILTKTAEGWR